MLLLRKKVVYYRRNDRVECTESGIRASRIYTVNTSGPCNIDSIGHKLSVFIQLQYANNRTRKHIRWHPFASDLRYLISRDNSHHSRFDLYRSLSLSMLSFSRRCTPALRSYLSFSLVHGFSGHLSRIHSSIREGSRGVVLAFTSSFVGLFPPTSVLLLVLLSCPMWESYLLQLTPELFSNFYTHSDTDLSDETIAIWISSVSSASLQITMFFQTFFYPYTIIGCSRTTRQAHESLWNFVPEIPNESEKIIQFSSHH